MTTAFTAAGTISPSTASVVVDASRASTDNGSFPAASSGFPPAEAGLRTGDLPSGSPGLLSFEELQPPIKLTKQQQRQQQQQ
eukprot:CAMPEP_0115102828 /NCGR_PEP_ID=MMETSP0227-20121206/34160_1 /TAXON_ID=89957 /ORGANISM="Polarella glacialis, Strain CCMP 1383" /LENGTH=81 /DNA_ID=CAMNT_0002499045 /DNA_START=435 /DNA_END=677 /DNA_ORIENTATION=+